MTVAESFCQSSKADVYVCGEEFGDNIASASLSGSKLCPSPRSWRPHQYTPVQNLSLSIYLTDFQPEVPLACLFELLLSILRDLEYVSAFARFHSSGWPSAAFLNQIQANGQDAWSVEICRHPTRRVHDLVQQSCLLTFQATWLVHSGLLLPLPTDPDSCRRSCLNPQALAICRRAQMFVRRMDPAFPDCGVQRAVYLLTTPSDSCPKAVHTTNPGACYTITILGTCSSLDLPM